MTKDDENCKSNPSCCGNYDTGDVVTYAPDLDHTSSQVMNHEHVTSTSYTIHHTPYTINHTPYTIHHTPYTIYHISYTIHHTPYTINHRCRAW
ncbi:hypothetical protein EON63_05645 [archaeon]|nr:MAG: hypothetical protein EON63_05645 [archaeon]